MPRTPPPRTQRLLDDLVEELLDLLDEQRRKVELNHLREHLVDLFAKGLLLHAKELERLG